MSRIAIILGRLVIGGTTMDTLQVAQHLQLEHEVLLITGGGDKDEFEAAYLTEHLPGIRKERIDGFSSSLQPVRDFKAYLELRKVLRRFKPDIVHTHTAKAGLLGRLAASAEHVPVLVHTYHGLMFHGYYNATISGLIVRLERFLARKTTRIIALSPMQKQQLVSEYKICEGEKVTVVPLGIDLKSFAEDRDKKRSNFRRKYLLNDDEVAVGIVGRIVPVKNHGLFLEVAHNILHGGLKARFFIIGDGNLRRKLQQTCAEMKLNFTFFPERPIAADITFTSWITEVDKAMAGLDVIALTSFNEGTPVSLMEAQASGKPVVATRAGGIDDIVQNGVTGFTVDQGNLQEFCEKLRLLIMQQPLRQSMGQAGERLAIERFRKERQVADLNKLYAESLH